MPAYLPHAIWVPNSHDTGGTYAPEPITRWKIVIHEIQGDDRLSMIQSHQSPPHTWYDPISRDLHQTVPLNRSAFALYHYSGRRETNKALALQTELAGFSEAVANEPESALTNIAVDVVVPYCAFVAEQGGQIDLRQVSGPFVFGSAASEGSVNRMSEDAWQRFAGLTGHAYVPQNEHWDPGAMDLARIAGHAALIIGGLLGAATFSEDDMATLINVNGTIWATNGVAKIQKRDPAFLTAEIQAGVFGDPARYLANGQLSIPVNPNGYQVIRDAMTVDEWGIADMPNRVVQAMNASAPQLASLVAAEVAKVLPKPAAGGPCEVDEAALAQALSQNIDLHGLASVIVQQLVAGWAAN